MHSGQQGWHRPILLFLIIWLSNTASVPLFLHPDTIYLTEPPVYHHTKLFEIVEGYMPLCIPHNRFVAVNSFPNSSLPSVLTAYLAI